MHYAENLVYQITKKAKEDCTNVKIDTDKYFR